jgi:CheY-like chemotaxis protein
VATVAEAAAAARPRLGADPRVFTVELPASAVWVDGDATRLAQVVANLLDNAFKFTDGSARVSLRVAVDGDVATIAVEDDGVGLAPDMLDRVFDMFTQADRPLDRKQQGGLGIGLTLVKRLTELHGGSVSASSPGPGLGSRFDVRLPLAAGDALPATAVDPVASDSSRTIGPRRVLVVDDNHDALSSQAAMLELMGHEVRSALDGVAALEVAAAFRPDLVLLDIGMPQLDGYEVCRRLRSQSWSAGLLIVAVTGWGQEADKRRAREAGFDLHLTKPMDHTALFDFLESTRRQPAAPRRPMAPAAEGM